ncbi:hypothetical protein [Streptomyces europaeiscabiei]|uniref:hypothetical protein n=1 Tax=Streptomyces europaeiscabiei TaxID=146819 RepID=UPI0029BF17C2|nr:hypothetical protein [Streptomyces europaeiscabiei]MDX2766956.1 hypothetical protein [Streptomyces europaeiscabiei]
MKARRLAVTVAREGALPVPVSVVPEPLGAERLAEIEARADAATAGPWCTDAWEIYQGTEYVPGISFWIGETCRGTSELGQDRADAAFVAAARSDVPALVAEVRRQAARIAELEAERHSTNEALSDAAERMRADRDRLAELEKREAAVAEFAAMRAEYITAIRNCHPDNSHDYNRWQGHAAARRQLSELLGLPVAWPVEGGVPAPRLAHVQREPDGEHYQHAHHDYRVSHDLPEGGLQ